MAVSVAFQTNANVPANTNKTWNTINSNTTAIADLLDESGVSSGYGFSYNTPSVNSAAFGANSVGSGDASWVDEAVVTRHGHYISVAGQKDFTITGPAGQTIDIEWFVSQPSGRRTVLSIAGQTYTTPSQDLNTTDTYTFTATFNSNGEISGYFEMAGDSSGSSYVSAMRIIEGTPPASFILSSTDIFPNTTVSGTGSNYTSMPSVLTMVDSSGRSFSSSGVSFPDLSFTGSAASFSFDTTTPAKPAVGGSVSWLRYGAGLTINIPDPGE